MSDGPAPGWFNEVAAFLGPAYLRNAFTLGTDQEVEFLVDALGLVAGSTVLDVGCGPGRHSLALARRGCAVTGFDLSPDFVALARAAAEASQLDARFSVGDVRDLDAAVIGRFDAVICLCQGGFGLLGGDDADVLDRIGATVRPGGRLALTAFSSYFAVRFLEANEHFDPATGVLHERATVRNEDGVEREHDLWTTCFTARELALELGSCGLVVDGVYGVSPGEYRRRPPDLAAPELLALAHSPAGR
ncbi:MAG TPA: methyltransferase domain-containing protein [Acidimicrobiia bacterium]|nr:methyltransferase domain-containing protein [Acidimicrobiia bacterium]